MVMEPSELLNEELDALMSRLMVGRRIRQRRLELGMNQATLAEELAAYGVRRSGPTLSRIETSATNEILWDVMLALGWALGVSPLWLSGYTEDRDQWSIPKDGATRVISEDEPLVVPESRSKERDEYAGQAA